jgi:hypothetical protein
MDLESIIEAANANEKLMDGTTEPVTRILEENDVVFAVWQDPAAENGVSTLLLKGVHRLSAIASEASSAPVGTHQLKRGSQVLRWSAVKVLDREMAMAAKQTLGEAE